MKQGLVTIGDMIDLALKHKLKLTYQETKRQKQSREKGISSLRKMAKEFQEEFKK